MTDHTNQTKRGVPPERVKVSKPWEDAVKDALKKQRPKDGWPDQDKAEEPKPKP